MVDVSIGSFDVGAASNTVYSRSRFPEFFKYSNGMDLRRLPTRCTAPHSSSNTQPRNSRITPQQVVDVSGDALTQNRQRRYPSVTTTAPPVAVIEYWSTPQANHISQQQFHQGHQQASHRNSTAEAEWQAFAQQSQYTQATTPLAPVIQISTAAFRPQDYDSQIRQQDFLSPYNMSFEGAQTEVVPMQHVPVSPVSRHSGPSRGVSPVEPTRKRSFSQLELENGASPSGLYMDDGRSGRITRTIKRPDAPMNDQHKYICDVSPECASLTFERKCEWSKHMDKHDRPYRCPQPSCAKLQGFTYSGGLLRHEREVHNKHGGPRAFLMCPHIDCKRHTEKGFTRRENLQEHLRRVHAGRGEQADEPQAEVDTPASAEQQDFYAALHKPDERSTVEEVNELKNQLQRLKAENEAKSAVIQRLEEDARLQNDRLVSLEHTLRSMQQV